MTIARRIVPSPILSTRRWRDRRSSSWQPTPEHLFEKLQATTRDKVGGAGIFDHVERILVAHVDDGRPDLALGASADGRQERERRRKLLGEVVDAEVGTGGT